MQKWYSNTKTGLQLWCSHKISGVEAGAFGGEASTPPPPLDRTLPQFQDLCRQEVMKITHAHNFTDILNGKLLTCTIFVAFCFAKILYITAGFISFLSTNDINFSKF